VGQHTWFYRDQELRRKEIELWAKLDAYDNGEIWLDDLELLQINHEINKIRKQNDTEYHDIFRTNKRNEDNTYIDDVILSKANCDEWLEENKDLVNWEERINRKLLNKFWEKYPNGAIDFR